MNILLISRCPPYPLHLGDRLIPYHLARQLSARGHQIDLIAFYADPADPDNTAHYESFFRSIQLIREPKRSAGDYFSRLVNPARMFPRRAGESWSPEMWRAIESRLASHHYDVIKVFGGIQVYEYRELVRQQPHIMIPYESYSLFLDRRLKQARSVMQRLILWGQLQAVRRYEQAMFNGYDRVVVLSETDAQALRALQPGLLLRVIPNGVDLEHFIPAACEPDQPVLLFTGNFSYLPNVDAALWLAQAIFPIVKQRIPQARLLLVGNNPPASMIALANDYIQIPGYVPDLRPYLQQALIFVSPLRFGAGIKNKVLEAMAMQKPVVATPLSCDGIGLTAEEHVLYGTSADELANAVIRLIQDDDLRQRMAQVNRRWIEAHYTWQRVADQYEALYQDVIRAHTMPRL